jgi:MFS family permease
MGTSHTTVDDVSLRRIALGTLAGTALETYDFVLYAIAAPLVFGRLFFIGHDPTVATLGAFATFALGFAVRPLGAIIFGHLGDRIGRRRCLIVTVTMIGIATCLIGAIPTYTSIGLLSPVLLTALRLVQGIATGGEWAGAMTLAVEHAPLEQRGRYAAMPQLGAPIGILLATTAFFAVSLLPRESFDAWGWRLPFLAALPMLYIALWLRRRVEESPRFQELLENDGVASLPVRDVVTQTFPQLVVGAGACLLGIGGYYLATTFVISYGTTALQMSRSLLLGATLIAGIGQIFVIILGSRLGERFSNAAVAVGGGLFTMAFAFPMFALIDSRGPLPVILAVTIGVAGLYSPLSVIGPLLADLFPVRLRYTGLALCSNIAGIASGLVPLIAATLQGATGGSWAVALLLIGLALVTTVAGVFAPRLSIGRDLNENPDEAFGHASSARSQSVVVQFPPNPSPV